MSVPAVILMLPLLAMLILLNKALYPLQPALFRQDRVGRDERALPVVKVRSMHGPGAGCTALGRAIRGHYLDELPQLLQVVAGDLSVVGVRVLPREVYWRLGEVWSPDRFASWRQAYGTAPLGLSGVHQVFRGGGKWDERRFHRDLFYRRRASLGLDLYLLWRTCGSTDSPEPYGLPAPAGGRDAIVCRTVVLHDGVAQR